MVVVVQHVSAGVVYIFPAVFYMHSDSEDSQGSRLSIFFIIGGVLFIFIFTAVWLLLGDIG